MTIKEAFAELIETAAFQTACKEKQGNGAKLRVYKGRFLKDELQELAMVSMLMDFGYSITVQTPKKKANK